jgi:glycosyltransferase involved in cell wall biosynthesis
VASLVSFVMPAWRPRRDWLAAAVESVLAEPGCDLELVIVDDGSPEPVEPLVADVRGERVRVIRAEHAGQSAARNAGGDAARGTHIRFVDCDDVVVAGGTAHLLALAEEADDVIAYAAMQLCDEALEPQGLVACNIQGDAETACLLDRFPVQQPAMLFPRRVVDAAGGWDVSVDVMADWEWMLRALGHAPVRGDDRPVYLYRRHLDSIQGRASQEQCEAVHHRIVSAYFQRHPDRAGGALERRARATPHLKYARTYLREGRRRNALDRLVRGLLLDPPAGAKTAAALALREARLARRGSRARSSGPSA